MLKKRNPSFPQMRNTFQDNRHVACPMKEINTEDPALKAVVFDAESTKFIVDACDYYLETKGDKA